MKTNPKKGSRTLIHERALRITYNDKSSSYGELLTKDNYVTIRHRNVILKIYQAIQRISPPLLNEVFVPRQCNYDPRGNICIYIYIYIYIYI